MGISLKAGKPSNFAYRPMGGSERRLRRPRKLKKGRRIRPGLYQLTFKAKPVGGGKTKMFRYRLWVR